MPFVHGRYGADQEWSHVQIRLTVVEAVIVILHGTTYAAARGNVCERYSLRPGDTTEVGCIFVEAGWNVFVPYRGRLAFGQHPWE